jgi:hypothetical protein
LLSGQPSKLGMFEHISMICWFDKTGKLIFEFFDFNTNWL